MTAEKILDVIGRVIAEVADGEDHGIRTGTFAEALADLREFGSCIGGWIRAYDPEEDGYYEPPDKGKSIDFDLQHLIDTLGADGNGKTIGTGAPLAYIAFEGCYTLIRSSATRSQIANETLQYIGACGGPEDDE